MSRRRADTHGVIVPSRLNAIYSRADLLLLQRHVIECDRADDGLSMFRPAVIAINRFVCTRFLSSVVILGTIVALACLAVR